MSTDRVSGIDISLNHAAFVTLDRGELYRFDYVTDRKSVANKSSAYGHYLRAAKLKEKYERDFLRLAYWNSFVSWFFGHTAPEYTGIEDYAYRAPQSAYHLGEVGGVARYRAWLSRAKVRLHDPSSLKMYAAHDGTADSTETMRAILKRWPTQTKPFLKFQDGKDQRSVEDLCDAYALAQLVWLEIRLRRGEVDLASLPPKEVQLFNRCTKRFPVSILGRDWIERITDG